LFELLTKSNVSVIQVSRLMACNVTYNEVLLFWSDITVGARWGLCICTKSLVEPSYHKTFKVL
jgi:hypothetical protein